MLAMRKDDLHWTDHFNAQNRSKQVMKDRLSQMMLEFEEKMKDFISEQRIHKNQVFVKQPEPQI